MKLDDFTSNVKVSEFGFGKTVKEISVLFSLTESCKSYKPLSFEEKEIYYSTKKHLFGLPSEKEIVENGMDIEVLLKRITVNVEELSLSQIELYKMILELKKQNKVLVEQINKFINEK